MAALGMRSAILEKFSPCQLGKHIRGHMIGGNGVRKGIALALAPLLLFAPLQPAFAKPAVLIIQPEGSQSGTMENGSQVITSQLADSTVVMRTPDPFDGGRTRIFFTFVNNGQAPVSIGPENITSSQITVVSYDQLIAEQKKSERWDRVIAGLGALGNSLSASGAGRQTTVTNYGGYADCGMSCGFTYSGTAVSQTYSPYAAQNARLQAEAQNRAAIASMNVDHASARHVIAANLRTTTVMPGHFITGMLTFEIPRSVRRGKQATPTVLQVRVGSDVHVLRGYAGAIGTTPPPPSQLRAVPARVVSGISPPQPVLAPQDAYARGIAYYKGDGVRQDFGVAASWFHQAADQGLATAQYELGSLYKIGKGVPRNLVAAANWYRKAADQGFSDAQFSLGFLYYQGSGVEKDLVQAKFWFQKAADQGNAGARFLLRSIP